VKKTLEHINIKDAEFNYFITLSPSDQLTYFFELYEAERNVQSGNINLKQFFNNIKESLDNKEEDSIEIDLTKNDIPDNFSLVDILIDDKRIMIESDSLRAIRKVIRKFMESGYIMSRDYKLEKTFKEDKVTRYMRVFKIINHGSCFSYN
jgi:hypothetical protein|tara:strand:+ start:266 stop:715 length:450 start_codon:yes stop_codon:yes gene_type:complete